MVIVLFGESCVGKSTIADALKERLGATLYTGKDYLRLAKSETEAAAEFKRRLAAHTQADSGVLIYVASEKAQLALLPEDGCLRVLVTAELADIQARFAKRMGGTLPPPVAMMLERKHGMFDSEPHDLHIQSGACTPENACAAILEKLSLG